MTKSIAVRDTMSMAPKSFAEAQQFASAISKSQLVPQAYRGRPDDILVAIIMGNEVGLAPIQSMQNIAMINGKQSMYGDALLAVVQRHPSFVSIEEVCDGSIATCTIVRRGMPPVVRSFSIEDAKIAKLWQKSGPWTQYSRRMLQMRARGFALRDSFADALMGLITAEEAQDYPSTAVQSVAVVQDAQVGHDCPSLDAALAAIADAGDAGALSVAANMCSALSGDDRERARSAYLVRRDELRGRRTFGARARRDARREAAADASSQTRDDDYPSAEEIAVAHGNARDEMGLEHLPQATWDEHVEAAIGHGEGLCTHRDIAELVKYSGKWASTGDRMAAS